MLFTDLVLLPMHIGRKTYQQLGKLVHKQHPDLASQILRQYIHVDALDNDLSNIPNYYRAYCNLYAVNGAKQVKERKLFLSAILRIYSPGIHNQHAQNLVYPRGLGAAIREAFEDPRYNVYRTIQQILTHEKIYESYRDEVTEVVQNIHPLNKEEEKW